MVQILAAVRNRWLLLTALLLALVKSIQLAIDSTPIYFFDSGPFIGIALRLWFIPERSFLYGALIRASANPFHSMRAVVAMQVVMGAAAAWLLAFTLIQLLRVRPWIALVAALVFAIDPMQVVYEHLVMTEASTGLAFAVFILVALAYLKKPSVDLLVVLSLFGILLVGFRVVYLPVVVVAAVLVPLIAACFSSDPRRLQSLVLALAVSCGSALVFHVGYRHLTGRLARREPAYHYRSGFFLMAAVAPLIRAEDTKDPILAKAMAEQNNSRYPLYHPGMRTAQLWQEEGFQARLVARFRGDEKAADAAAGRLARTAILRDPFGFLKVGLQSYWDYITGLRRLPELLHSEIDHFLPPLNAAAAARFAEFGIDMTNQHPIFTLSGRYYIFARSWCAFLLAAPYLALLALWLRPDCREGATLILLLDVLVLAATCLGGAETLYRYLHIFSFTGLLAAALLVDRLPRSQPQQSA